MIRAAWSLACMALAGCLGLGSDPWAGQADDPCAPGNARTTGQACVVPDKPVVIDGDAADWAGVAAVPIEVACVAAPCPEAAPAELQLARVAGDAPLLAVHVRLTGGAAPSADPTLWYQLRFTATPVWPSPEIDVLWGGAGGVHFTKAGTFIDPPASLAPVYQFALTGDGFEAAVPIAFLPFVDGTIVTVTGARQDDIGQVTPLYDANASAHACWQVADYTHDPCAGWL